MALSQTNLGAKDSYPSGTVHSGASQWTISGLTNTVYTYLAICKVSIDNSTALTLTGYWNGTTTDTDPNWSIQKMFSCYKKSTSNVWTKQTIDSNGAYTWSNPKANEELRLFWRRKYNGTNTSNSFTFGNNQLFRINWSKPVSNLSAGKLTITLWAYHGTPTTFPTIAAGDPVDITSISNLKAFYADLCRIKADTLATIASGAAFTVPDGTGKLLTSDWQTAVNAYNAFDCTTTTKTIPTAGTVIDDAYFNGFNIT